MEVEPPTPLAPSGRPSRRAWVPWVVLALTLSLSLFAAYSTYRFDRARSDYWQHNAVRQTRDAIEARLQADVALLRGVAGLFAAEGLVSRYEFRDYVARLDLAQNYPGIQAVGFSRRMLPGERQDVLAELRETGGVEGLKVWGEADAPEPRDEYHAIIYLEPLDDTPQGRRNQAAMGYDMFTHPVRRAAMERARDTGEPAMSGRVVLKQEIEGEQQSGFLIYLPVYEFRSNPATIEHRRARLAGFAYAPFRAGDFFGNLLGDPAQGDGGFVRTGRTPLPGFSVYAGPEPSPERLLYRSDPGSTEPDVSLPAGVPRTVEVGGQTWALTFRPRPVPGVRLTKLVLFTGAGLSLAMFFLARSQASAQARAERSAADAGLSAAAAERHAALAERGAADLARSEAVLRETERRFRSLAASSPTAIFHSDAAGRCLYVNARWQEISGQTAGEALGGGWAAAVHPDDRARVADGWAAAVRDVREWHDEFRLARPDGEVRWVSARSAPIRDAGGGGGAEDTDAATAAAAAAALGYVGTVEDVTERHQAEQALQEAYASVRRSDDQLRLITDALPVLISYIGPDQRYRFNNRAYEQWFGTPAEALRGRTIRETIGESAYAQCEPHIRTALSGRPASVEDRMALPDGRARHIHVTYTPHLAPDGTVEGVVILVSDVSERKRAESSLRRYADLFEHAELGLVVVGPDCSTIELANPALARLHGLAPGELTGRPLGDLFVEDYRTEVPSHLRLSHERGGHAFESMHARADGSSFPAESHVTAVRGDGDGDGSSGGGGGPVLYYILSVADVTDRERIEQEREQLLESERAARTEAEFRKAEAEAANRSKDEFLATLSHELRTPLNAILGWAQLLRTGHADPDDLSVGLETIERNARAQAKLVEDLLDLSRIISGRLRLDPRPVELSAVVAAALETVRPAAEAKGVRLVPALDGPVGPVLGDPDRIQQVTWNLLSNAIKFTPRGGTVELVLRREADGGGTDGQAAEIVVRDTGQGIRPEFLPHVFDRLRQADASTTRRHGGLGLGLAIVRHLVELHGGTVRADSAGEGMGTTFTVRLPLAPAPAPGAPPDDVPPDDGRPDARQGLQEQEEAAPAGAAEPSLAGVRVLVVDDEPDARDLIARLLRARGAEVAAAASAAEAMEALGRGPRPDVLLSDIGMPDEDGYSLVRRIRAAEAGQGAPPLPAAALTAFARAEDRHRALEAGFQTHIPKPVAPLELAAVVAELAGRAQGGRGEVPADSAPLAGSPEAPAADQSPVA